MREPWPGDSPRGIDANYFQSWPGEWPDDVDLDLIDQDYRALSAKLWQDRRGELEDPGGVEQRAGGSLAFGDAPHRDPRARWVEALAMYGLISLVVHAVVIWELTR
jgi:hypothetical protein